MRRSSLLACLAVCALAVLAYLNSLGNGFAQDDNPIIVENPRVHGAGRLVEAITAPYWPETPSRLSLYRPVTSATFALEWGVWAGRPFGFHLTNVALHTAATALVFVLLLAMGPGLAAGVGGAAIFAVHPVHVEAVANVVGRSELLAALFFMAACLVYVRRDEEPTKGTAAPAQQRRWLRPALVGGLYFLSMGSKEIGVMLPVVLPLLALARPGPGRPGGFAEAQREWRVYAAAGMSLALYLALRASVIGVAVAGDIAPWYWGEPATTRIWTAIRLWPEYARLLVAPLKLLPDYAPGVIMPERTWQAPGVLGGVAIAVAAAALALLAWKGARLVSLGVLWFVVTILPVSGILFDNSFLLAERTLYLPSIGMAVAVAGAIAWSGRVATTSGPTRRRFPLVHRVTLAAVCALGLVFAWRTWLQNPVWRDDDTLFAYLVAAAPESYRAKLETAVRLDAAGRIEEALAERAAAVALVPGHFNLRVAYGQTLYGLGRYGEAAAHLDAARRIVPEVALPHALYLESLVAAGEMRQAVAEGEEIVARFPENAGARASLERARASVESAEATP